MPLSIAVSPAGHIRLHEADDETGLTEEAWHGRVRKAFRDSGASAGLFALAATRPEVPVAPPLAFWREFACRYLGELCHAPEPSAPGERDLRPIAPPPLDELRRIALGAPPMVGGEYLAPEALESTWIDLDTWIRAKVLEEVGEIELAEDGAEPEVAVASGVETEDRTSSRAILSRWLEERAPDWHPVGRVCLHLAENPDDAARPFAFLATFAPRVSRQGRVQYRPLGRALQESSNARDRDALLRLLTPIQLASEQSELIRELVESGEIYQPLAWTPDQAHRLLVDAPLLEDAGLIVRLPNWWSRRPRPRVRVTVGESASGGTGLDALLDFRVDVALGDQSLTPQEWEKLLAAESHLVLLKGQWVEIDRERLSDALEHWRDLERRAGPDGISFVEGMRLLAGAPTDLSPEAIDDEADGSRLAWSDVHAGAWLREVLAELRDPARAQAVDPGPELEGTLRPYQETGFRWLWLLSRLRLGACLADDMGLGKTIQVIALLIALQKEGSRPRNRRRKTTPSLLVVPASLLGNWRSELARFAPTIGFRIFHASELSRSELQAAQEDASAAVRGIDLAITTYGMLVRADWLQEVEWRLVILDEAQAIKNPATRQTRAAKKLRSGARVALTGTPVENRLSDIWSLFDFLSPGLLGSASRFTAFVRSLDKRSSEKYAPLRALLQPYILRRLKTDRSIIADLPEKTEVKVFCGLAKRQAALYTTAVRELATAIRTLDGMKRRGLVLKYLVRFKQICNHPSHLLGDGEFAPKESGKLERLRVLCEEIASRQEKVLVFTQFREMASPLADFLAEVFGATGLVLHGGTGVRKRRAIVDAFQREDGPPFFVLSLKAGGTGLNLTAASHVIHFDRWWNPAVENQATDRAFRIGQTRNVLVHKFICRGTVEERIDALIEDKLSLNRELLEGDAGRLLTEMDDEELLRTVALDVGKARI